MIIKYILSVESKKGAINIKRFRWEPGGCHRCTKSMVIEPFWFSMEHLWIVIVPFWLSTDDIKYYYFNNWIKPIQWGSTPWWGTTPHLSRMKIILYLKYQYTVNDVWLWRRYSSLKMFSKFYPLSACTYFNEKILVLDLFVLHNNECNHYVYSLHYIDYTQHNTNNLCIKIS